MRERWLIVSYFANVDGMACSHHIDDRIAALHDAGIDVHLISSTCGNRRRDVQHTRIAAPWPSGLRYELRYWLRRHGLSGCAFKLFETLGLLPLFPAYLLEKLFVKRDATWSWYVTGALAVWWGALRHRPRAIYSTGGPVSAHLAALRAAKWAHVPCIVEFQDPVLHDNVVKNERERQWNARVEKFAFEQAAAVIFLTHAAAAGASARHSQRPPAQAIYAGMLPPPPAASQSAGSHCVLAHFGSLAGTRNLAGLFGGLEILQQQQPDLSATWRLQLYGNSADSVQQQIAAFPQRERVESHGKVPRPAALAAMSAADVVLVIQDHDDISRETIPSKVYEYLLSGRPVLALLYRNPELTKIITDAGQFAVEVDDHVAIAEALRALLEGWHQGELTGASASPYTVQAAVSELRALVDRAVA